MGHLLSFHFYESYHRFICMDSILILNLHYNCGYILNVYYNALLNPQGSLQKWSLAISSVTGEARHALCVWKWNSFLDSAWAVWEKPGVLCGDMKKMLFLSRSRRQRVIFCQFQVEFNYWSKNSHHGYLECFLLGVISIISIRLVWTTWWDPIFLFYYCWEPAVWGLCLVSAFSCNS